jgi:hypothetical protein
MSHSIPTLDVMKRSSLLQSPFSTAALIPAPTYKSGQNEVLLIKCFQTAIYELNSPVWNHSFPRVTMPLRSWRCEGRSPWSLTKGMNLIFI